MATCLVTGGAGFLGSHLCDELLRRGHRVICVDNFETGSLQNIEHIRVPEFAHLNADIIEPVLRRRAGRLRLPLRLAGVADRLPAAAAAHAQGRLLRHPPRARPGQAAPRALPDRLHERGLRRPEGPPAARVLLGARQPDRPARRLRRGQALRRGADDGLPPPAGRRHRRSCGSSTPTGRGCAPTTAGRSRPSCARRSRTGRSPCSATAPRRARSPTSSDLVDGIIRLAESGYHQPVNVGNPNEFTLLELAQTVIEVTGSRSEIVHEALPTDDPQIRQPDISLARELLGWEPTVELREGLGPHRGGVRDRDADRRRVPLSARRADGDPAPEAPIHLEASRVRAIRERLMSNTPTETESPPAPPREPVTVRLPPQDVRRKRPPVLSFLLRMETLRRGLRVATLLATDFAGAVRGAVHRADAQGGGPRARRRLAGLLRRGGRHHRLRLPASRRCCSPARASTPTAPSAPGCRRSSPRSSRSPSSRSSTRSSTAASTRATTSSTGRWASRSSTSAPSASSTSGRPGSCCARRATAAGPCSSARARTSRRSPTRWPTRSTRPSRCSASSR